MRRHAFLGVGLTLLAMLAPALGRSADETTSTTGPWTFEKTWFRGEKHSPLSIKWFEASGVLTVSTTSVAFLADKKEVSIPIPAIRQVSLGHMKGDSQNEWVIVEYDQGGTGRIAGFKDGKGFLGGGANTVAIHDAIRSVLSHAGASMDSTTHDSTAHASPAASPAASSGGASSLTWAEFNRQIKEGFPRSPDILLADPKTMGMLLIDGDLKSGFAGFDMDGIGLTRTGMEGVFRAGAASGLPSGCVLFTGLEPGEYVLKIARGSSGQGWAALEAPESPDLKFQVEAGKIQYIGHLRLKSAGKTNSIEKKDDPAREKKIWARFATKYAGTSWAALAEEHSRAIQGE